MKFEFLVFDCMDTLIQMDIPSMEIYSDWAYGRAADLGLWENASIFRDDWVLFRRRIVAGATLREGTVMGRLREMLRHRVALRREAWTDDEIDAAATAIHEVFWRHYVDAAHVLPEVPEFLRTLQERGDLSLGVASNFMVPGGIPELLSRQGLAEFFDIVIVSCDVGWRKPAEAMYRAVIEAAGCPAEKILFVGDHPLADYEGPRIVGMTAVLYDPKDLHPEVEHRVGAFDELAGWL